MRQPSVTRMRCVLSLATASCLALLVAGTPSSEDDDVEQRWMGRMMGLWARTGTCGSAPMCGRCGAVATVVDVDETGGRGTTRVAQAQACGDNATAMFDVQRSLFEIASNTKVFTALLLQQLVANGTVELGDKLGKFLPRATRFACAAVPDITLHMLGPIGHNGWGGPSR